ncbi:hypothetical protein CRM22_006323 [Opisthorchis felineus]|nr:hypothetical protein CRM22_006323 [Opisthorchis felineus]
MKFRMFRSICQADFANVFNLELWAFHPACFADVGRDLEVYLESPKFITNESSLVTVNRLPINRLPVKSWLVHIRRGKSAIRNSRYLDYVATNLLKETLVPKPYVVYPVNPHELYHQDFLAIYTPQSFAEAEREEVTYTQVEPVGHVSAILGIMQTKHFEVADESYLGNAPTCPSGTLRRTTVYTVVVEGPSYTTWTTKALQMLATKLSETEFVLDSGLKVDSDLGDIFETYHYLLVAYRVYMVDNKTPANLRTVRNPYISNLRITRDELSWPNAICRKQIRPVSKLNVRLRIPFQRHREAVKWNEQAVNFKTILLQADELFKDKIRSTRIPEALDLFRIDRIHEECSGQVIATGTAVLRTHELYTWNQLDMVNLVDSFNEFLEDKLPFEFKARFTSTSPYFCSNS